MASRNVLYRIFDEDGNLLYVGATTNPQGRFMEHGNLQPWWDDAAVIRLEKFPTRKQLLDAEDAAIQAEHPRYNTAMRGKPTAKSPRRRLDDQAAVYQRESDPLWVGAVELPPIDGRRRRRVVAHRNRQTAQAKLDALRAERDRLQLGLHRPSA